MTMENIMHTYRRFDVTFENGTYSRLFDTKGNKYIDFLAAVAVNCLSHSGFTILQQRFST